MGGRARALPGFFCICNGTILSTVFFLFLVSLKYPPLQRLSCLLNPCSQRSLSNFGGRRARLGGEERGEERGFSNWEVGQEYCLASFVFVTGASCTSYFYSFIEIA